MTVHSGRQYQTRDEHYTVIRCIVVGLGKQYRPEGTVLAHFPGRQYIEPVDFSALHLGPLHSSVYSERSELAGKGT